MVLVPRNVPLSRTKGNDYYHWDASKKKVGALDQVEFVIGAHKDGVGDLPCKWIGITLGKDQRMYCAPYGHQDVLVVEGWEVMANTCDPSGKIYRRMLEAYSDP